MEFENYDFAQEDAQASLVYPAKAGSIKRNGFIVIRNEPCKVINISTHQDGKHGHAKASFVALSILSGKRYEDNVQTSHNVSVPFVERNELTLIDIDEEDGFLTLMDDEGEVREDLTLPHLCSTNTVANMEEMERLSENIQRSFRADATVILTILKTMGKEKVIAMHED